MVGVPDIVAFGLVVLVVRNRMQLVEATRQFRRESRAAIADFKTRLPFNS